MTLSEQVMQSSAPHQSAVQELLALPFVSTGLAQRRAVATDRSGSQLAVPPVAVAQPTTIAQVQQVVRAVAQTELHIVPRGAGTGLAGGAVALEDSVVLDLSGLNRIHTVDPVNRVAVVEPGVITSHLDARAREHGLRYAPDPASAAISTIGGNIATNAGGFACVKYGVTRDSVRSLKVVLADGTLVETGPATVKGVAGYDLTSLFVGSEGTLGAIVQATVALHTIPTATATLRATFPSAAAAAQGVTAVLNAGVTPSLAEFLDAATLRAIDTAFGSSWSTDETGALLILQTDGFAAEEQLQVANHVLTPVASHIELGTDTDSSDELLTARRQALPAIEQQGRVLIEDISVPLDQLSRAVELIGEASTNAGVPVFVFAHAGDGNLHPIVLIPHGEEHPDFLARVEQVVDRIFQIALELGGTISGEHGIGHLKKEWLARELGAAALTLHRKIKAALDPSGILNPGKAF